MQFYSPRPDQINQLRDSRCGNVFYLPEEWADESFKRSDTSKVATVLSEVVATFTPTFPHRELRAVSDKQALFSIESFEDTTLIILQGKEYSRIESDDGKLVPLTIDNASARLNNIKVGKVQVVEHVSASIAAFGLAVDLTTNADSFPTDKEGLSFFNTPLRSNIVETDRNHRLVGVKEPSLAAFDNGAYVLFEPPPDPNNPSLVIDHQFSHSKNALGTQRTIFTVTPEAFAYIASARTLSYGFRRFMLEMQSKFLAPIGVRRFNIDRDDAVRVGPKTILNPNPKFDHDGYNYEALMHEVIDKLGALGLIEGKFVGKVTFHRTNHSQDLEAIRQLVSHLKDF